MREQLLGYLLGALDEDEHQVVRRLLDARPELKEELAVLRRQLAPLDDHKGLFEPSPGLGRRTLAAIPWPSPPSASPDDPRTVTLSRDVLDPPRGWSVADLIAVCAVILAAISLFAPAIQSAQQTANTLTCQNNLRLIGQALHDFAARQPDHSFPAVFAEGPRAFPGNALLTVADEGYLAWPRVVICPSSPEATQLAPFHRPTMRQLLQAQAAQLAYLQRLVCGSYAYPLGVYRDGRLVAPRDERRANFVLVSDAPRLLGGSQPRAVNHGRWGQNLLYEDGHVQYCMMQFAGAMGDHPFLNNRGQVGPGVDKDDSVVGGSSLIRVVGSAARH